ncbi:MAG: hypothetical protein KGD58_14385 [Candidatus Lokiarchaeota archaeon]|nr:hypothetical protein [Candidatus Lokiarchaeota archaeon]
MKLWIIYKEGFGFSKMIAEMLQDRLEDYIDISVGNAKKIEPAFLVEERLDYLIIGDVVSDLIPSAEIQNWLFKYKEISKNGNLTIKIASGFYVAMKGVSFHASWADFLQDNVKSEIILPPVLLLKLSKTGLSLKNGSLESIKGYINDIIEFFINNDN